MKTAAVVTQAHGQTVCLPQDFRLDGDEVYVKKVVARLEQHAADEIGISPVTFA